jgi:hypothetical protein
MLAGESLGVYSRIALAMSLLRRDQLALSQLTAILLSYSSGSVVTVQNPSGCLTMSTVGPLQKFTPDTTLERSHRFI